MFNVVYLFGVAEDIDDAAYLAIFEADLDASGVMWRAGEEVLYNTLCAPAGALILLKDDLYFEAGINLRPVLSVHGAKIG
jgi:hypothetical protein